MKAVIIAAGRGTRLRPITYEIPKGLIKINNTPLLEHAFDQLVGLVDSIVLVVGYKAYQIKEYFGDNYKGMKIEYVEQKEMLGTAHALYQTKDLVRGKFLYMMGDDLYSRKDMENCLKHDLAILGTTHEHPERYGAVITDENGIVTEIVEKPRTFVSNNVTVGMFVFDDSIYDEFNKIEKSPRGEYEHVDLVRNLIKNGRKFKYVEVRGYWIPVGYLDDIKKAEEFLKNYIN